MQKVDLPIKRRYAEVMPQLTERHGYTNVMALPRVEKIVLNMGVGEAREDSKVLEKASRDLANIALQRPVITKAKKSVSNFKLRAGMSVGLKVTLRGERMWAFLDKLINVALPRVRDFRGISANAFDGRGNYSLGLKEQLVFPEISYDQVDATRGMDITIVTTAKTDEEATSLLELLGMPFRKYRSTDGHQSPHRQVEPDAQVRGAHGASMQPLRPRPGLPARLRPVPHLCSRDGPHGLPARRHQGVLVTRDNRDIAFMGRRSGRLTRNRARNGTACRQIRSPTC